MIEKEIKNRIYFAGFVGFIVGMVFGIIISLPTSPT